MSELRLGFNCFCFWVSWYFVGVAGELDLVLVLVL